MTTSPVHILSVSVYVFTVCVRVCMTGFLIVWMHVFVCVYSIMCVLVFNLQHVSSACILPVCVCVCVRISDFVCVCECVCVGACVRAFDYVRYFIIAGASGAFMSCV